MKFLKLDDIENVHEKITNSDGRISSKTTIVPIENAHYKELACDIISSDNVPNFVRSTVDGYAVKSSDVNTASDINPIFLTKIQDIEIGQATDFEIANNQCAAIPTGAMLPKGADAALMIEYTEKFSDDNIAIYKGCAVGENIVTVGEDVLKGDVVLKKGTLLKPKDIGVLAALGIANVLVYAPLTVTIISTGDELVPIDEPNLPFGKVRDINTYALQAQMLERDFIIDSTIVIKDQEELLKQALEKSKKTSDIVLVSGGSSKGEKDISAKIINMVANPGVCTHGLAISPGKPTIIGKDSTTNTLFVGLPGHPKAAMLVLEALLGNYHKIKIPATLTVNVAGALGKRTFLPCVVDNLDTYCVVTPILGKSGLIATLSAANGYFIIPRDTEGLYKGDIVWVYMF